MSRNARFLLNDTPVSHQAESREKTA